MADAELNGGERAELDQLRQQLSRSSRWGRRGRWVGACAVLLVAAVLATFAVVASTCAVRC